jgi:hypothetical protein
MLRFYVEKREEGSFAPEYKEILEFSNLDSFLRWANYHHSYIEKIETLDGESVN